MVTLIPRLRNNTCMWDNSSGSSTLMRTWWRLFPVNYNPPKRVSELGLTPLWRVFHYTRRVNLILGETDPGVGRLPFGETHKQGYGDIHRNIIWAKGDSNPWSYRFLSCQRTATLQSKLQTGQPVFTQNNGWKRRSHQSGMFVSNYLDCEKGRWHNFWL